MNLTKFSIKEKNEIKERTIIKQDMIVKFLLFKYFDKYLEDHPKSSPIPWFNKHVKINKKQSALQETESTNYVIGAMSDSVDYDELPNL